MPAEFKKIIVVGGGHLADSLKSTLLLHKDIQVQQLNSLSHIQEESTQEHCLLVHAGSGRLLEALIKHCQTNAIALIQASTGLASPLPSKALKFVYVEAPNLALPIIKFMALMKEAGKLFGDNSQITITESHQAAKKTVAGTAQAIACSLGVEKSEIKSIRIPEEQLARNIPASAIDGHAAHWVSIKEDEVEISFSTCILGRESYGKGLISLQKKMTKLSPGHYQVTDLL